MIKHLIPHTIAGVALLSFILHGCFVPATVEPKGDCKFETKEWTVELSKSGSAATADGVARGISNCGQPECLLVAPILIAAIPVTSAVISGSVMIIGNTIHWIEKQGACEDSEIQTAIKSLKEFAEDTGGYVVWKTEKFIGWARKFYDAQGPRPARPAPRLIPLTN